MAAQLTPHLAFYLAAGFCGLVSLVFLIGFFLSQHKRADFRVVATEWKGLGGGLGGLRLSTSLSYALIAALFGLFMTLIVTRQIEANREEAQNQFELQKLKETDTRKYEDAKQAREIELEKARLAANPSSNTSTGAKKGSAQAAEKN